MSIQKTLLVGRAQRRIALVVCGGALVAVAGPGTTVATTIPDDSSVETAPAGSAAPDAMASVVVTLTETSIDGLPDDLVAGVVDVTVMDAAGRGVDFSRVQPGTDPAKFVTDLAAAGEAGDPLPDSFLDHAGVVGHSMITLDEGEYVVWTEPVMEGGDIITAALTVGPGDNDAVIPPTDGGSIWAGDYLFNADVTARGTTVTFTNSSDNQFHHVVLIDAGINDPALVEEYLPTFLETEGAGSPPEGIDMAQFNDEFASSGVFGPGSSGTFEAPFEEGNTYIAVCFISDREGGLPHAYQHRMYDVFQVEPDGPQSVAMDRAEVIRRIIQIFKVARDFGVKEFDCASNNSVTAACCDAMNDLLDAVGRGVGEYDAADWALVACGGEA